MRSIDNAVYATTLSDRECRIIRGTECERCAYKNDMRDWHCEEGTGAWIKNRDNSPFTVLDLNSGKAVGPKESREIVKSCGLCTSYDDMLVVGEDGNAYIVPGRTAIKLSEENFKVTWRKNGK